MMKMLRPILYSLLLLGLPLSAQALSGVNPTGLNVSTTGPSTAFLTFLGTAGQTSTQSFWCGAVSAPAGTVTDFNPCVAGTECGRLPARHDLSRQSGLGDNVNFTDIMTIPASISRCAYQDARSGSPSSFFYIRQFISEDGSEQYTSVTCRLSGGGARSPLALTHVDLYFRAADGKRAVYYLEKDSLAPALEASIHYTGSGYLKGRWELVVPGDNEPSVEDLLPEASLPLEQRASQQRYQRLSRIQVFLPPGGETTIPGPDPAAIPTDIEGPYKILFRVEASRDRESYSATGSGVVASGGVAGFAMPVLRYYVSDEPLRQTQRTPFLTRDVTLFLPLDGRSFQRGTPVDVSWVDLPEGQRYRLDLRDEQQTLLNAYINPGQSQYTLPPWITEDAREVLAWRIVAMDRSGTPIASSLWREFSVE